jgi:uncharacterized protein (DUF885 family)
MPLHERTSRPVAGYLGPAPFDADLLGQFLLTPVDVRRDRDEQARQLEGHCAAAMPLTTARETYPGRHVRQLYANQAPTRLRRVTRNAMMTEGWALYAEELMGDEGFCAADPAGRIWQRLSALRSGCLALVDAGLHAGGMTTAEAESLLVDDAGLDPAQARVEVVRCCVAPTRGLATLAGKAALVDLRTEARRKLGERYEPGRFHDAVLAAGAIPFTLVREELWERLATS